MGCSTSSVIVVESWGESAGWVVGVEVRQKKRRQVVGNQVRTSREIRDTESTERPEAYDTRADEP